MGNDKIRGYGFVMDGGLYALPYLKTFIHDVLLRGNYGVLPVSRRTLPETLLLLFQGLAPVRLNYG